MRRVRLGFEYQGGIDHDHAAGRAADTAKFAEAEAVGIRLVPVVKADVRNGEAFLTWLKALVTARERELDRRAGA